VGRISDPVGLDNLGLLSVILVEAVSDDLGESLKENN
jgi:hypothetical protein